MDGGYPVKISNAFYLEVSFFNGITDDTFLFYQDIQTFIDEAQHGVILFTFGSVVKMSSLPLHQRRAFLDVFASIPQRVIWKYEEPIKDLPENIMISKWLPQRDILGMNVMN